MDYRNVEKRLRAAASILQSKEINKAKFDDLKTLLSGIHPKLDNTLAAANNAFSQLDHIHKGEAFNLIATNLPEFTPEQKKRKKILILFLKLWKDLESEVNRIKKELESHDGNSGNTIAKIFSVTKGPLGIITLVAAVVAVMKITEVSVVIKNIDCKPIAPPSGFALSVPGLKVPSETITMGGEAVAKLPPLTATVDATSQNNIQLKIYGMTFNFALESPRIKLFFNDKLLNGTTTSINLGSQKIHTLAIRCN